jgi:dihydroflavonol-4-reductase
MNLSMPFWAGKRVCITGGTGFLGWTLAQQLRPLAGHVRLFGLRPRAAELLAQMHEWDCVFGDVRDWEAVHEAVHDCDVVFHSAGTVAVSGPALRAMRSIHIDGTNNVLRALPAHARLVHTSSVTAVGARRGPVVFDESSPFHLQALKIDYVHAKKAAEDLALAAAAQGRDIVVVNPGFLIGPEDYDGSIMGRFCLRCFRGKVPLIPPGGMSLVDVRDVAQGHLLAAERGVAGRRYILGGENLTMVEFVRELTQLSGRAERWSMRMPTWLHYLLACGAELRGRVVKCEPFPSLQHVRLNRYHWYYSSARARAELGYETRRLSETLADMFHWNCCAGLLKRIDAAPAVESSPRAAA